MFDTEARVEVTFAIGQQHAIGIHACAIALQQHIEFMARKPAAKFQIDARVLRIVGKRRVGAQEAGRTQRFVLHTGVGQLCAVAQHDFAAGGRQVRVFAGCEQVLDHRAAGASTNLDPVPQMPGSIGGQWRADADDVDRRGCIAARFNANCDACACQYCIQTRERRIGSKLDRIFDG